MAVKGIGSNYLYPVQNDYKPDSKTEDTKNAVSQTAVQKEGVSYEKTIPDSVSAGLEYIQGLEKQISGTKFFVGTVSYGQTYGNSSDIIFVINPKFLSGANIADLAPITIFISSFIILFHASKRSPTLSLL